MNLRGIREFVAARFTSFRFAWGMISLFFSIGTFTIVLTDKFPQLNLVYTIIVLFGGFMILSVILDKTRMRHRINYSESKTNPMSMDILETTKEIKTMLEKQLGVETNESKKIL